MGVSNLRVEEEVSGSERRAAPRYSPQVQPEGQITLELAGNVLLEVISLRDVSPFGLGINTYQTASSGADVRIVYEHEGKSLVVRGAVVWVKEVNEASSPVCLLNYYQLGIKLDSSDMAANLSFFRALAGY